MKPWKTIDRYLVKIPAMIVLMLLGFILEFLITFPWMMAVVLDNWFDPKRRQQ